ncbi:MAG: hypothetical protein JXB10_04290 [Pirellulales bacterium]|nr:hypothetical protein [Pirellulales bacterium]
MKSEERHKLQQNELADFIAKWLEALKPYQNTIYAVVIVVLVAVLLWVWWSRESTGNLMAANNDFSSGMMSQNTAALNKVLDQHPDSKIASAAAVAAADLHLRQGTYQLFQDPATANQQLQAAVNLYNVALNKKPEGILREQALFGLARAEESLGKLKAASSYYQQVIDADPEGVYAELAYRRWKDLERTSTKEFYDKFAEDQKKPTLPGLSDLPNPNTELDFKNLPQEPIFSPRDPLKLGPTSGGEEPAETGVGKESEAAETDAGKGSEPPEPAAPTPEPPESGATAPPAPVESEKKNDTAEKPAEGVED